MKSVVGMVVSNKMQKSVVVAVDRLFHNKLYNRYVKRTSKFMAHDESNHCNIGDRFWLVKIGFQELQLKTAPFVAIFGSTASGCKTH
ncbi:hypothetical protein E3N88_00021 [Mikania micrantha]|uniref:30S ribosomal protein S17, chloroplastic n=1 Tax=Mikania micrantha TaxID=192012 RepID=A0A5N6PWW7_9ASTR|nr:hypothetical protein E3N88_00021 [Mikania micrantha]